MTLGERQPDTPIVGVPPAPKKSVCCTACHLCRTQECVPRIENACQQCDVCGMQVRAKIDAGNQSGADLRAALYDMRIGQGP
jgi:hypothetical protein